MKYEHKQDSSLTDIIIIFICTALVLLALPGCYTNSKAAKQVHKAIDKKPLIALPIFRGEFPCITTGTVRIIDSTDYKIWKDSVDKVNTFYGELLANIEPEIIHETDTLDCDQLKKDLAKYKANDIKQKNIIGIKDKQISALNERINNVKPVKDSSASQIEDLSRVKEKDVQLNELQKKYDKQGDSLSFYKKLSLWTSLILVALAIFFGVRFYLTKKLLP